MLGDKSVQKFEKGLAMDVEHLLQQYFSYMAISSYNHSRSLPPSFYLYNVLVVSIFSSWI